jgi:predicted NUDIX family NTP pyrophosphohydrolase
MKKKESSGLLVARVNRNQFDDTISLDDTHKRAPIEYLLVHPGGPFYENKDQRVWSIPKGEIEDGEVKKDVALREFKEETNLDLGVNQDDFIDLGNTKLKSGKIIHAYGVCVKRDFEIKNFKSNNFEIEWPYKSGKIQSFPEVDKIDFLRLNTALEKINPAQQIFLKKFEDLILNNQVKETFSRKVKL